MRSGAARQAAAAPHPDLFGPTLLPGLAYGEEVIDAAEEAALIARITAAELTPFLFQQWTGRRLTLSFGLSYDFRTGRIVRADPIPGWLTQLRDCAARFAGLEPRALAQALLIEYGDGAGIGWHRDRPIYGHVIGISLGAPATMRFRKAQEGRYARAAVPLAARSIYHMNGEARHDWEHSIAPMSARRWSVTFRSLAPQIA